MSLSNEGDGSIEPNRNNEAVNNVMERAHVFASENYHEYVTIEHLLWALLHEKDLQNILTDIGGRPNIIRNEVENHLKNLRALPLWIQCPATSLQRSLAATMISKYAAPPKTAATMVVSSNHHQ